jgi:hypothetical protein
LATWTAINVQITKQLQQVRGVGLPDGNVAIFVGFTSDIMKDGVFHHKYNENNCGVPKDGDYQALISGIIQNHLQAWNAADSIADNATFKIQGVVRIPDPVVVDPAPIPDPAILAFNAALSTLLQLKPLVDAGVIPSDDPDYASAVKDAQNAYQAKIAVSKVTPPIPLPPVQNLS